MNFADEYSKIKNEIIAIRRKIHANPELAFEETNTANLICQILDNYKISYKRNIASTGICATIGNAGDKVLLIRADMDALPIEEKTGLPFSSTKPGVMHACGHDMHIAAALASAIILKSNEEKLNGTVKIVFQPGEETTGGAEPMIAEGILSNPEVTAAIGGHITPEIETGYFKIKSGALMASPDDFSIRYTGRSTHGAEPQNGISPIKPACAFVNEEIPRLTLTLCEGTPNVLSICTVCSNGGVNTIPDEALILGTFRSFDEKSRVDACDALNLHSKLIGNAYGVKTDFKYNFLYPPVINDEEMTNRFTDVVNELYGPEQICVMDKPFMTGDDFSYFGKYVPSVYFWYGAKTNDSHPLHSSEFVVDEDAIEVCANIFVNFSLNYLE